jgi:hypothetical protein
LAQAGLHPSCVGAESTRCKRWQLRNIRVRARVRSFGTGQHGGKGCCRCCYVACFQAACLCRPAQLMHMLLIIKVMHDGIRSRRRSKACKAPSWPMLTSYSATQFANCTCCAWGCQWNRSSATPSSDTGGRTRHATTIHCTSFEAGLLLARYDDTLHSFGWFALTIGVPEGCHGVDDQLVCGSCSCVTLVAKPSTVLLLLLGVNQLYMAMLHQLQ